MSRRKRRYVKPSPSSIGIEAPRGASPRRRAVLIAAAALAVVALLAGGMAAFVLVDAGGGPARPRAAIIDELGVTDPNPTLLEQSRQSLVDAGYAVDMYPNDQVTVDLFRRLPERGYRLVIIRGHSAGENSRTDPNTHAVVQEPLISLFTSEPYSRERYVDDQRALRLDIVQIGHSYVEGQFGAGVQVANPPNDRYFGITPAFMENSAKGKFRGTTVLLMGCDAANTDGMASALIKKGAGVVAGWDGPVSVEHTDAALAHVLQHLLSGKLDPGAAVAATMADIGPDPSFGAKFIAYPKS